jgi:predicted AAA+ superfamily ATPase
MSFRSTGSFIYLADSGRLHALLGITNKTDLDSHPKLGASWEGFAISQVTGLLAVRPHERFFWATHTGAELDLPVVRGRKRWGSTLLVGPTPRERGKGGVAG